ncbi:MAG TPA: peptidase inhibitor family I36 protein [Pseudonocardiaceae bacterium]|nr:peptidase inhibitor family I36 protein [Pseudonocardiaceae bacterium]
MQRRFGVMIGAVALGFVGALSAGPSAAAGTVDMGIQSGFFYAYEHDDFKGGSARFQGTDKDLSDNSWDGQAGRIINDNISSVKNQTDRDVYLYEHSGCTGDPYLSQKHSEDKDLNNNDMENKASCVQFE